MLLPDVIDYQTKVSVISFEAVGPRRGWPINHPSKYKLLPLFLFNHQNLKVRPYPWKQYLLECTKRNQTDTELGVSSLLVGFCRPPKELFTWLREKSHQLKDTVTISSGRWALYCNSGINIMGVTNCFMLDLRSTSQKQNSGLLLYSSPGVRGWMGRRS